MLCSCVGHLSLCWSRSAAGAGLTFQRPAIRPSARSPERERHLDATRAGNEHDGGDGGGKGVAVEDDERGLGRRALLYTDGEREEGGFKKLELAWCVKNA
uniref:ACOC n=1 Tax=Arundo donax TaxID=35708 RepID=A0A0A9ACI8_ARUDO